MALSGAQQRGEFAEDVGPDRFSLERSGGDPQFVALSDRHREMVRPEGDEPLDDPTRACNCFRIRASASARNRTCSAGGFGGSGFAGLSSLGAVEVAPEAVTAGALEGATCAAAGIAATRGGAIAAFIRLARCCC